MRIGLIARADDTGLGNQSLELAKMLNPSRVLIVDSSTWNNGDFQIHPEWYSQWNTQMGNTEGWLLDSEIKEFLDNVDVVISCEIFYSDNVVVMAREKNIKTILQFNYEFLHHMEPKHLPDVLLAPSLWHLEDVKQLYGSQCKIIHLPPPTDHTQFEKVRQNNLSRNHKRLLHVVGKAATQDRNGTNTIIEMLKYAESDFEIVFKVQVGSEFICDDPRARIEYSNVENRADLYDGFDALILPRRFAGLCLPMNEALLSGLPVLMTDISPNNRVLPKEWLIRSGEIKKFNTRRLITAYGGQPVALAQKVDSYMNMEDKTPLKERAFSIGYNQFSQESLKPNYLSLFEYLETLSKIQELVPKIERRAYF